MKKRFLILFLLKITLLMSQTGKDNYFPPTPEANSLMRYVDVPVNYSTGVTNYSIPIHTIKLKNLNIPITLTYQSSGLKPSEIASNVGLGWELNAGGKITQNVVGQNDIENTGPTNPYWNLPHDKNFKLPLPLPDYFQGLDRPNVRDSLLQPHTDYFIFNQIDQFNIDTKPDIFYYSTSNKSGKFFFASNRETKQIPFGKDKIVYGSGNGYFEITDTEGVRYIYGVQTETANLTTNTCLAFPALSGSVRNNSYTYYLTQIITSNNETVDFIYETVKYNLMNDKDYTRYYHSIYGGGEKITSYYSEITTKVLTKIKVNQDYEIDFLYKNFRKDIKGLATTQLTAPKTLDNIKVTYKNEVETYKFDYGYFGISDSSYDPGLFEGLLVNENTGYKLKLKSFQKTGENPYVFSYYNEAAVERYTPCLDHWGYYSDNCNRYTMNILFGDFNLNQKLPNLEKSKTNVLQNVTLPTKGEVEFSYELNACSNVDMSTPIYDWAHYSVHSNVDDQLSYQEQVVDSIFTVPENYATVPAVTFNIHSQGPATTENNVVVELYEVKDNGQLRKLEFVLTGVGNQTKPYHGYPLEGGKKYKLVLRCKDNEENQEKFVTISFLTSTNVPNPITSVGGLRIGDIKTKESGSVKSIRSFEYDIDGQSSGLLYEKPFYFDQYGYFANIYNPEQNNYLSGEVSYAVQHSRIPTDLFGFNGYHIFYKKVTEKVTDVYNPSNKIKTEKYFTFYDDIRYGEQTYFSKISYNWKRGLPSQINEFNNGDVIRKTTFSYNFLDTPPGSIMSSNEPGFPLNNPTFPNEFYKRSIDLHVYARNESRYHIYSYSEFRLISAWYYMDKKTVEENLDGKILKREEEYIYDNPAHAQLTSQTTKSSKGEIIETKYFYPDDLLGEPLMSELKAVNRIGTPIITEQYKGGNLFSKNKTVFAKDASTGNLLLPKEVYSAKFPNDLPSILNVGNLEKKIVYNQYDDKGNVLQYTPESGIPVSIIWGYNKTQPIAKIENATYTAVEQYVSNLQNLSDLDNDNCMSSSCKEQTLRVALNALRANFQQSMVTTYTYNPLVGVTSITDPKGISSYYEYDAFNRLKFIKDKDLNILQKYCYNYKGQQVDCSDNSSTSTYIYKSMARSGFFAKNNCGAGGTGSSITFAQAEGAVTSTISQSDADSKGLDKFNSDGQANANAQGGCSFSSVALSGSFTKNSCGSVGVGSSVAYSQSAGVVTSTISQANADSQALNKFNIDGQANANASGYCTFSSGALSGTFTKNNCALGGSGSSVGFNLVAGSFTSTISQADADAQALSYFNAQGQANANANGYCTFSSGALSGAFTKNNCASGGSGSSVVFNLAAGSFTSMISQADADAQALAYFNTQGQVNANANGYCTFYSVARSGAFTKNNCASGGSGSSVGFSLAPGSFTSTISQADADAQALSYFNAQGQANANTNGYCTFYSVARSGAFTKNNCPSGGAGSNVGFNLAAGSFTSTISQADADAQAINYFNAQGQANANANGYCTFYSVARSGAFTKNNCASGGSGSSVGFNLAAGSFTSTISQADADAQALTYFNAEGQANANAYGYCVFYSSAIGGSFTKNNCASGGTGSNVGFSLASGAVTSTVSQADADARAQTMFNTNGQAYANANGYCTFYSVQIMQQIYKNDYCPPGTTYPYVYYYVPYAKYQSNISQNDADGKAWNEVNVNGQAYANANGRCLNPGELEE
ncbi:DUF5977 domain-containing protein [Flavobacterium sp. Fl-77]|uniref:DUF5977 domain-containing protein n=1 Tax=Flavobacterium flavipigmentatum TaxID=2893884 RepID=A0AAJ2SE54_9FLAO|nr:MULTISPECIES: DUF5977 domain-containing protein [unclassified Flavobacterium]MDX6183945.1 DUF5977 domain-containing protein [Flavobacterium sp. Fl-33]MDX6187489.1 DUF5977 domain-containing protein [Flavobacterium sp. Fl-77]UFH37672.1 DUF5977 domain-containing protein [Flavobacterium sp. F-70]